MKPLSFFGFLSSVVPSRPIFFFTFNLRANSALRELIGDFAPVQAFALLGCTRLLAYLPVRFILSKARSVPRMILPVNIVTTQN